VLREVERLVVASHARVPQARAGDKGQM
jgi:hypothetical protein